MPSSTLSISQPITTVYGGVPPSAVRLAKTAAGIHRVGVQTRCGREAFEVSLEDVHRARLALVGHGIDEHQRLALVE